MKFLSELKNLEGVKALVRLDLNVPIKKGMVLDDFRIRKSIPTIKYLQEKGAKIILMSHIQLSASSGEASVSLKAVAEHLKKLGTDCIFVNNYRNAQKEIENLANGGVILLENLRGHEGEEKNDKSFAKQLASLADIYVNDAFAVSHRAHASISAITEFIPSYAGPLFESEIKNLSTAFNPDHPALFILGGAKFETKLPLIDRLMKSFDKVFVGGALANDFFREQGKDIGTSMVSKEKYDLKKYLDTGKILLPIDSIKNGDAIMDAGPLTLELLKKEISQAKYILWNGPLGAYEQGFKEGTLSLARLVKEGTDNGAKSILGGGDTLAVIAELQIENDFTFVSTGGGAMLDYLAKGTLPGIEALENSKV